MTNNLNYSCRVLNTFPVVASRPGYKVKGFETNVDCNQIVRQKGGEICTDGSAKRLTVAQQRTFLFPNVFNSGCITPYARNQFESPCSIKICDAECQASSQMYDQLFSSTDQFVSNGVPLACTRFRGGQPCC